MSRLVSWYPGIPGILVRDAGNQYFIFSILAFWPIPIHFLAKNVLVLFGKAWSIRELKYWNKGIVSLPFRSTNTSKSIGY